jgi:hypothetical protein
MRMIHDDLRNLTFAYVAIYGAILKILPVTIRNKENSSCSSFHLAKKYPAHFLQEKRTISIALITFKLVIYYIG